MATSTPIWKAKGYANVGAYNRAIDPNTGQAPNNTTTQTITPDIKQLESTIKSGNFSASDARAYNKATGNQQGARELALGSQQAVNKMQTAVTADEFKQMQTAGIQDNANIGKGITADLQGGTTEQFKQQVEKPIEKISTKNTEQTITPKLTNLGAIQGKNIISEAPTYKGADGQTYKTVRFEDQTLGTVKVDAETGISQLIGNTYDDSKRAETKQIVEQGLNDTNNIYNVIQSGGSIPEAVKKTPQYTEAKNRYNTFQKYSSYNTNQFASSIANGELLAGTQTYNDLIKDPNIKIKLDNAIKLNALNGKSTDLTKTTENQSETILNNNLTVKGALEDGSISQEEFNKMTNNDQIVAQTSVVTDATKKYNDLKLSYDQIEDEVNSELEGTGATSSYRNALIAQRQKKIYPSLIAAQNDLNLAIGNLSTLKADATALFNTNLELYKTQEARAYEEQAQTRQLEQNYAYQYGDLNSTNPTLQNIAVERAVADMYTKYPIPGMESQAIKVQKVKDRMAQGMTGTEAIASVESEIRNSQRYKDYLASEKAKITPTPKITEVNKDNILVDEKGNVIYSGIGGSTIDKNTATSKYGNTPAVRNFNPGNIMDTSFGGQKVAGERFTVFNTPQEGFNALVSKIENIQAGGSKVYSPNMTLLQYISKYAPASDNNNPSAYANSIAKDLGITSSTKIKDIDAVALARAHSKHEDRNSYQMLQDLGIITGGFTAGTKSQTGGAIDAGSGVPIEYARRIKSMVPATLMNSEIELQNLNDTIKSMYNAGTPPEEALLTYMGVELKPNTKELGLNLISKLKGLENISPSIYTSVSDDLNSGNIKGAIQTIENNVYKGRGVDVTGIDSISQTMQYGNRVKNKIAELADKFGPIAGRVNEWNKVITDDPTLQGLQSDMTNFIAQYRNKIAGASITGGEEEFMKNLVANIKDNPQNAQAKVISILGKSMSDLNSIRDRVGLPTLKDWRSAYDINYRSQAYTNQTTKSTTQAKPTTTAPSSVQLPILNRIAELRKQANQK